VTAVARAGRATAVLALVLSAVAGFVDVSAYLSFGIYAANMTGNAIAFAIGATGRGGASMWQRAATIAFFFAGGLTGAALIGDTESSPPRARPLAGLLAFEATLLVVVVLLAPGKEAVGAVPIGLGLLTLAAGMQNVSLRRLGPVNFRTTHMTGRLTRSAETVMTLGRWLLRHGRNRSARRRWALLRLIPRQRPARTAAFVAGLFLVFVAGGCAGALALSAWGESALVAPAVVLFAAALAVRVTR
jgi:uncharacterized membrane protein YoaK (UPF0700 family)